MEKIMKKKIMTLRLACLMAAGMQTAAFAEDGTETVPTITQQVTKHFKMAEGITTPDVTFSFTAAKVTADAPDATIDDLTYSNTDEKKPVNGLSTIDKTAKITFEDFLHAGLYEYKVTETAGTTENGVTYDVAKYDLNVYVINQDDGTLKVESITAEKNGEKQEELSFTNTYRKDASLTISKTTVGAQADKTKDFTFTIKFEKSATESDNVNSYTGKIGEETVTCNIGEEQSFQLHDGESLVFDKLPAGTRYVVKEEGAKDGYTPSIKVVENGVDTLNESVSEDAEIVSSATGTNLVGESENSVDFTNTYEDAPLTGIVLNNWPVMLLIVIAAAAMVLSRAVRVKTRK